MQHARLLIDEPLSGPQNMARDEALLRACTAHSPITLRFYAWQPATISLGYFQEFSEYERLDAPAGDLPVVRRTTGGGAILHDQELTYSITIPLDHPLVCGRPNRLYTMMHEAIISAVGHGARLHGCGEVSCDSSAQRGPFFCFARRHALDIVIDDPAGIGGSAKLAGSAQRRTQQAILQHGSIILESRFPQQPVATWKALGVPADYRQAGRRILSHIEASFDVAFTLSNWSDAEIQSAADFEKIYAGAPWTRERERIAG